MSSSNGNGNGNSNGHGQPAVIGPEFMPDEAMMARLATEALQAAALPAMSRAFVGQSVIAPPLPPPPDLTRVCAGRTAPG